MDTLTIIIIVVMVVVALAQWRKKPMAELSRYTPERVMEMRIYLLIAWEYNILGLGDVIIRNRGGVVTVEEYRKGIKVAHYEGELKEMVPLILRRYGWEGWKLKARFF